MSIILNGTTGITTPDVTSDSGASLTTRVAKTGDTMTGSLTIDTATNGTPQLFFRHANSEADNFQLMAGTPGVTNGGFTIRDIDAATNRLVIDSAGRTLLNGAGSISGAGLVVRSGGLAATNSTNESTGCITFPARIASGTNFVIAQITGVNTNTMVTASCEYVNIYNWNTSGSISHGTVHAAIRSSTGGSTGAHWFVADQYSYDATYPSFYFTGTSTINLNLTGAASNEGIAYITIAWRNCTMSITPST